MSLLPPSPLLSRQGSCPQWGAGPPSVIQAEPRGPHPGRGEPSQTLSVARRAVERQHVKTISYRRHRDTERALYTHTAHKRYTCRVRPDLGTEGDVNPLLSREAGGRIHEPLLTRILQSTATCTTTHTHSHNMCNTRERCSSITRLAGSNTL